MEFEVPHRLGLTAGRHSRQGMNMGGQFNRSNDSLADAVAILVLIILAVSTAVFWVSQQ